MQIVTVQAHSSRAPTGKRSWLGTGPPPLHAAGTGSSLTHAPRPPVLFFFFRRSNPPLFSPHHAGILNTWVECLKHVGPLALDVGSYVLLQASERGWCCSMHLHQHKHNGFPRALPAAHTQSTGRHGGRGFCCGPSQTRPFLVPLSLSHTHPTPPPLLPNTHPQRCADGRPKLQPGLPNEAPHFRALCTFTGFLYKKYPHVRCVFVLFSRFLND